MPSIIHKHTTPRPVLAKFAQLLDARRDFPWTLKDKGTVNTKSLVTCQEARAEDEDKRPQELRQRLELVETNARGVTGEQQVRDCDSHEEEPEEQEEAARVH